MHPSSHEGGYREVMDLAHSKPGSDNVALGRSEWSHRRSAAFLLVGGTLFWAIILLVLAGFGFF